MMSATFSPSTRGPALRARPSRSLRQAVQARGTGSGPSGSTTSRLDRQQNQEKMKAQTDRWINEANANIKASTRELQAWWDQQEEKPLLIAIGFFALALTYVSARIVDVLDGLPLISDFLEFVGFIYSGYFVYRNLLFRPDRQRFRAELQDFIARIVGKVEETFEETEALNKSSSGPGRFKNQQYGDDGFPKPKGENGAASGQGVAANRTLDRDVPLL